MPFRQSQSVSACVHFHRGGAAGYVMLKQFPSHSRHLCKSAQHLRAAQEENSISHTKKKSLHINVNSCSCRFDMTKQHW